MARLRKASQAEDARMPLSDSFHMSDDTAGWVEEFEDMRSFAMAELDLNSDNLEDRYALCSQADDADDERRQSAMTATSVSSFPDSTIMSDNDPVTPILKLYTPRPYRSSFRWPGSASRADKAPPSPLGSQSPRRTKLAQRSRAGTPRSIGISDFRGSPKYRRRISEATEAQTETEEKQYPLVLLHVTLLPVRLPWSSKLVSQLLPADTVENMRQLKAKASETILSRGILISHPREEFELLEERLLEALELQGERLTKCGHFRTRSSISSASDSDSGIGSTLDGSENELCAICQHHIKPSRAPVGSREKKWTIKVFAANGLLKPSAWAAAWSDMEAVDVEILPWIDEDLRRQLDAKAMEVQAAEQRQFEEDEEERLRRSIRGHEQFITQEDATCKETEKPTQDDASQGPRMIDHERDLLLEPPGDKIPNIYQPSQIPVSVLLRNYFYLLSQDWRNVAIAALSTIAIFLFTQLLITPPNLSNLRDDQTPQMLGSMPLLSTAQVELASSQSIWEDRAVERPLLAIETVVHSTSMRKHVTVDDTCALSLVSSLFILGRDDEVCLIE